MIKILLTLTLLIASLYAKSGQDIYDKQCASCHQLKGMKQMQKMGQMKAPAFSMVSMRLKKMQDSKEKFIAFVEDYIQNPSQEKGFCMPMAYKRFGVMPPIGKAMSAEDRKIIATWLYDNFNESWDKSMDSKTCKNKNKKMKRGSGKCGEGKCGSK